MSYQKFGSAAPYYDDFLASNNLLRIMFNPARAVQARELTQLATILQNQVAQLGNFIFKDNSNVFQAQINVSQKKPTCTIQQFAVLYNSGTHTWAPDGSTLVNILPSWIGKTFQNTDPHGSTAASKTITITGFQLPPGALPILFYEFSGADVAATDVFFDSDITGTSVGGITIATNATRSLTAECGEGIIWCRGHFVTIPAQSTIITVDAQDGKTYQVGFTITERVVTSTTEGIGLSLDDPANGSPNANAPGADRYQITPTLTSYDVNDTTVTQDFLNNFAPFVLVENAVVTDDGKNQPQFAAILDIMAKRTYDTNGDFIVDPFTMVLKEVAASVTAKPGHTLDETIAGYPGYDAAFSTAHADYLVSELNPGTAFVRGYEIQTFLTTRILVKKGRDVLGLQDVVVPVNSPFFLVANLSPLGSSIIGSADPDGQGNNLAGSGGAWLNFNHMEEINITSAPNGQGRVLSRARLHSIDRSGGVIRLYIIPGNIPGTPVIPVWGGSHGASYYSEGSLVYYTLGGIAKVYECLNNSGTFNSTIAPPDDSTNWEYIEDIAKFQTPGAVEPIQFQNLSAARSIVSVAQNNNYVNLALDASDPNNVFPIYGSNPIPLIYGVPGTQVVDALPTEMSIGTVYTYTGTVSGGNISFTSNAVSGGTFNAAETDLIVFAYVVSSSVSGATNQLLDPNQITVSGGLTSTVTLGFGSVHVAGHTGLNNGDVVTVALKETRSQIEARTKTLSSVTAQNISIADSSTDLLILSDEDVAHIVSVVQLSNNTDTSFNTAAYGGTGAGRILSNLELIKLSFDNGQRDFYYDYGSVSGFSNLYHSQYKATLAGPTVYQVNYVAYQHESNSNKLFFNKNSYSNLIGSEANLPQYPIYRSPVYGNFDLQKSIDFRRKTSEMGNTLINILMPQQFTVLELPGTTTHYVSRYDVLWVDKTGQFGITNGVPSTNPVEPVPPPNTMTLYTLGIFPYTFNTSNVQIIPHRNARYTMADISKLEQRIQNLEEYVSLSLLEQNANDLQITDPNTGFDSFKSGIFADPFTDNSRANVYDPHYRITGYSANQSATTPVEFWNMPMTVRTGFATTAKVWKDLVTLQPTGVTMLCSSLYATETLNVNPYLFYVWKGGVTLNPAVDTWYDTVWLPTINITEGSWDPPAGFNPNPVIDTIQQNWVGFVPGAAVNVSSLTNVPSGATSVPIDGSLGSSITQQLEQTIAAIGGHWQGGTIIPATPISNGETFRVTSLTGDEISLPPSSTMPNLPGIGLLFQSNGAVANAPLGNNGWNTGLNIPINISSSSTVGDIGGLGSLFQNSSGAAVLSPLFRGVNGFGDTYSKLSVTQTTTTTTTSSLVKHTQQLTSNRIVSTTQEPYMRSRQVNFIATGFRPGMSVVGTLDKKPVTLVVDSRYKTSDGRFVTSPDGTIEGSFFIPQNTFTAGTKLFQLNDSNLDAAGQSAPTSGGSANYTAFGYLITEQQTITTIRSVDVVTTTETTQNVDVNIQVYLDPLAQSFLVSIPGGVFLSSCQLFFATKSGDFSGANDGVTVNGQPLSGYLASVYGSSYPKDVNNSAPMLGQGQLILGPPGSQKVKGVPLSIYLVTMVNGQPTSHIVPFSKVTLYPDQINSNPVVPRFGRTTITWADPIYLNENQEYALVISSSSKEYNVWTATLSKQDIFQHGAANPGQGIAQQAFLGELFESKNSSTWVPNPLTNLAFALYYYQFAASNTVGLADSKKIDDVSFAGKNFTVYNPTSTYDPLSIVFFSWSNSDDGSQPDNTGFFQNLNNTTNPAGQAPASFSGGTTTYNTAFWSQLDPTGGANAYDPVNMQAVRYGSAVTPIIGELSVKGTSTLYQHVFYPTTGGAGFIPTGLTYHPVTNMDINDVSALDFGSSGSVNVEKLVDNASGTTHNYAILATLSSTNPNLTPVLDKQQMRAVLTRNLVHGIDPNLLWGGQNFGDILSTMSGSGIQAAFDLAKLASVVYSPNAVIFVGGATNVYYYNASGSNIDYSAVSGGTLEATWRTDKGLGKWKVANGFVPPFIDGIPGVGDAGAYVSQTVNLSNPSDNLTVILDVMKNHNSYINVYYRTGAANDDFLFSGAYNQSSLDPSMFVNQPMKLKYFGKTGDAIFLTGKDPATGTINPQMSVSSFESLNDQAPSPGASGNLRYKIHISAVSELKQFADGLTYDSTGNINNIQGYGSDPVVGSFYTNVQNVFAMLASDNSLENLPSNHLPNWSSTAAYAVGDIVNTSFVFPVSGSPQELQDFRVWKSNALIADQWSASPGTYATNDIVVVPNVQGLPYVAYKANASTVGTDVPGTSSKWDLQVNSTTNNPIPAFGKGTKPTALGTAWTEIPTISLRSSLKVESDSSWKPMSHKTPVTSNANLADGQFYEYTYVPAVAPSTAFSQFAVRVDLRTSQTQISRCYVPQIKNLRAIATL